jgi:hypothetical protein
LTEFSGLSGGPDTHDNYPESSTLNLPTVSDVHSPTSLPGGRKMALFESNDPDAQDKMRQVFGPGQIDQLMRQAIQMCWMMLPSGKRTVDELEKQIRRIMERAMRDLRKDHKAFGLD